MPTDPPLPELLQADLDDETLRDALADIGSLTTILETQRRTDGRPERCPFPEAAAALLAGEISALQVCYLHDGAEWRDTFLRRPSGARLVRMKVVLP